MIEREVEFDVCELKSDRRKSIKSDQRKSLKPDWRKSLGKQIKAETVAPLNLEIHLIHTMYRSILIPHPHHNHHHHYH